MQITVKNLSNESGGIVDVSDRVFGREYNEDLIHQLLTAYQLAARSGSSSQKNRAAVRGGGKKPWKQKGSGRARAGSSRSPIWRGGGVTFAARHQDYSQKINRKMYRAAMASIVSELHRAGRLIVVESFDVEQPKTKDLLNKLNVFGGGSVLIISESISENLYLSARNIPHVDVRDVGFSDPVSLIGYDKVLATAAAVKRMSEAFA